MNYFLFTLHQADGGWMWTTVIKIRDLKNMKEQGLFQSGCQNSDKEMIKQHKPKP